MFSEIDGVSRVIVETSFGRTCDSAGRSENVVEGEPFLAELPLERDEALDLLLAKLGLHGATLAASADGDQAQRDAELHRGARATRAAAVTSPFASRRSQRLASSRRSLRPRVLQASVRIGAVEDRSRARMKTKSVVSASLEACASICAAASSRRSRRARTAAFEGIRVDEVDEILAARSIAYDRRTAPTPRRGGPASTGIGQAIAATVE